MLFESSIALYLLELYSLMGFKVDDVRDILDHSLHFCICNYFLLHGYIYIYIYI
jgi:hypothetical protein